MADDKPDRHFMWRLFMCQGAYSREECYDQITREQARKSRKIDQDIEREREGVNIHKVLLLGGPGSGKSTIFKQMKIIHLDGFSDVDFINFRCLIHSNTMESMYQIIEGAFILDIGIDQSVKYFVDWFIKMYNPTDIVMGEMVSETINVIYAAPFVQLVLARKDEIELLDSAIYFLDNLDRIAAKDYRPSIQDVLRSRITTTGIVELRFKLRDHILKLIDVGGQRSEQRKWIHCFDNSSGILFVAELSAYNMKNTDPYCWDGTQNRQVDPETKGNKLKDTMRIFKRIANTPVFSQNTAMILFLNKVDIFKEKLTRQNIDVCFTEYKGPPEFSQAAEYIQKRFERLVSAELQAARPTYVHFTNATDTKNIDRVFDSCLDVVFKRNMERVGLGA